MGIAKERKNNRCRIVVTPALKEGIVGLEGTCAGY
jgi:hypothetical protein